MAIQATAQSPAGRSDVRDQLAVWRAAVLTVLSLVGTFVVLAVVAVVILVVAVVWFAEFAIEAALG